MELCRFRATNLCKTIEELCEYFTLMVTLFRIYITSWRNSWERQFLQLRTSLTLPTIFKMNKTLSTIWIPSSFQEFRAQRELKKLEMWVSYKVKLNYQYELVSMESLCSTLWMKWEKVVGKLIYTILETIHPWENIHSLISLLLSILMPPGGEQNK